MANSVIRKLTLTFNSLLEPKVYIIIIIIIIIF